MAEAQRGDHHPLGAGVVRREKSLDEVPEDERAGHKSVETLSEVEAQILRHLDGVVVEHVVRCVPCHLWDGVAGLFRAVSGHEVEQVDVDVGQVYVAYVSQEIQFFHTLFGFR